MQPGKDFEDRFAKRCKKAGWQVHKLPDSHSALFDDDGQEAETTATRRFSTKNPYDFRIDIPSGRDNTWWIMAIECKTVKGSTFPLSMLKDHQIAGLAKFRGRAGVVFESRLLSRAFFLTIGLILGWEDKHHKKSMNINDLHMYALELPRNTTSRESRDYYDVTPFYEAVKG